MKIFCPKCKNEIPAKDLIGRSPKLLLFPAIPAVLCFLLFIIVCFNVSSCIEKDGRIAAMNIQVGQLKSAINEIEARNEPPEPEPEIKPAAPPAEEKTPKTIQFLRPSLPTLFAEYIRNEVAANEKFKGQPLEIRGRIKEITTNLDDEPVLCLSSRSFSGCAEDNSFWDIEGQELICVFSKYEAKYIAKMKLGQEATIRGLCVGKQ